LGKAYTYLRRLSLMESQVGIWDITEVVASVAVCPLVPQLIGVVQPRHASSAISLVNKYLPSKLNHLKRIKLLKDEPGSPRLCLLLGTSQHVAQMTDKVHEQLRTYLVEDATHTALVPSVRPKTEEEYEQAKQHWPLSVPPPSCEPPLEIKERMRITEYMKMAFSGLKDSLGAVVVDPLRDQVIAKTQEHDIPCRVSDLPNNNPLCHCAIAVIEAVSRLPPKEGYYLCSDLDLFITREPCIMCAMAILHSRFQRVFYCEPDALCGALGSVYALHSNQSVNHRFKVYRVAGSESRAPRAKDFL